MRRDQSAATVQSPMIIAVRTPTSGAFASALHADLGTIAVITQQGPATPDHVIRTKRVPMVGRDLAAYQSALRNLFQHLRHAKASPRPVMLDAAPRVILDPEYGLITAGRTAREAAIAAEIYRHTMDIILRATATRNGWQGACRPSDIFDVEYWDLEQAKLRKAGTSPVFTGEIALVTGAASGIGKACVDSFLKRGAAVVGLDLNPRIARLYQRPDYHGITCDLTDEAQVRDALEQAVRIFGGLDLLVLNAGIFPAGSAARGN